jgi:hypothetical protein
LYIIIIAHSLFCCISDFLDIFSLETPKKQKMLATQRNRDEDLSAGGGGGVSGPL